MNLQALMKQAQSMQKNIMDSKSKIEAMEFTGESELVTVVMSGKNRNNDFHHSGLAIVIIKLDSIKGEKVRIMPLNKIR